MAADPPVACHRTGRADLSPGVAPVEVLTVAVPPSAVKAGHTATFRIAASALAGEGVVRWGPDGRVARLPAS